MDTIITSSSNNLIKLVRQLKQKKGRDKLGKYTIEGIHLVEEAIHWTNNLEMVLVAQNFNNINGRAENQRLMDKVQANKIPVVTVADNLFTQLVDTETPQGVIGIVKHDEQKTCTHISKDINFGLIIDNIQDPGNLGTIIRTADAAGFRQVLLTKGTVDPYNAKVLRAAMGSHFHLKLSYIENEEHLIQQLKDNKITLAVAHVQEAQSIYRTNASPPVMLVLGNEAHGPNKLWLQAADLLVKIPLLGKAESLNVAIAGAVIMYEFIRQNRFDH